MTPIFRSDFEGVEIPHKHDKEWYQEQIGLLPYRLQDTTRQHYRRVFTEAWHAEPIDHRRSNAARRAANIRLREYVEKVVYSA